MHDQRVRLACFVLFWIVLSACSDRNRQLDSDSRGVISANGTLTPEVMISTIRDRTDSMGLSSITDAVYVGHDIAVLDGQDRRLHIFGQDGELKHSFGRFGEGPGEFRTPRDLTACGDSSRISVWDAGTGTLTEVTTEGTETRRTYLPGSVGWLECAGDRLVLGLYQGGFSRPTASNYLMPGKVVVLAANRDTTSMLVLVDTIVAENRPLGAVSSVRLSDSMVAFATGTSDSMLIIQLSTLARSIVDLDLPREPSTDQEYRAAIEAKASLLPREEDREVVREILRELPMPDSLPLFRSIALRGGSQAWITRSQLGKSFTEIAVVDLQSGTTISEFKLPPDADILDVSRDQLLVRYPDAATGGVTLVSYLLSGFGGQ